MALVFELNQDAFCANIKFKNQWSEEINYALCADGAMTTNAVGKCKTIKLGLFGRYENHAFLMP